jgi:hypothetical protein
MNNPYLRAIVAFAYIICVSFFLQTVPPLLEPEIPALGIALMLSVFVLSVALMAFLFFFTPLTLAIEKKFKESAWFFGKTAISFLGCVAVLLLILTFF